MASSDSDYVQGSMPVEAQTGTFGGFMNLTVYGGCFIAFFLLFPILVFCTPLAWFPSLIAAVIFGVILGLVFKLKGVWYAAVIVSAIILALASLGLSAIAN